MKLIKLPARILKDVETANMLDKLGLNYDHDDDKFNIEYIWFNIEQIVCVYAHGVKKGVCIIDFVDYSSEIALPLNEVVKQISNA